MSAPSLAAMRRAEEETLWPPLREAARPDNGGPLASSGRRQEHEKPEKDGGRDKDPGPFRHPDSPRIRIVTAKNDHDQERHGKREPADREEDEHAPSKRSKNLLSGGHVGPLVPNLLDDGLRSGS